MSKINLILLITIVLHSCLSAQTQQNDMKLSALELSQKISDDNNAVVVDVRTAGEFEKGHLKNAVNIDWNGNDFDKHIAVLDKSQPVYVYCLSGGRSAAAAEKMRNAGFKTVFEMPGGMMEWRAGNFPEIKKNSTEAGMSIEQYEALLNSEKMILIDFYADWCAPCKKMKPYLEKIAIEMADKITLIRINADENEALCKTLKVSALPVLKLYKNKTVVWESEGYIEEQKLREQLQ